MNNELKTKRGVTLMEMTVVIAAVAILTTLSMPAVRTFFDSLGSAGSTKAMIGAALSAARATAIKEHRYAGIRFQKAYCPQGPLEAPQYMIFIVQRTPEVSKYLTDAFRAVDGLKPVKLPDSVGVMDLRYRTNPNPKYPGDNPISNDSDISNPSRVRDTTTFSVIFSPAGKLVIHDVRVRNTDGVINDTCEDDIFNTQNNVEDGIGMFYQDDYTALGLGKESSRSSFVIYDRVKFKDLYDKGIAYSEYLEDLADSMIYINPYTGTIVNE